MNWTYRLITHQYIDYQVAFDRKASEVLIPVLLSHRERVRSRTYIKSGHVIHRENNQQGKQVFYGSSITVVTMTSSDSIDPLAPWRNSDYRMDLAGTKYAHWYFNKIHLEEIVTGYHYLRRQR